VERVETTSTLRALLTPAPDLPIRATALHLGASVLVPTDYSPAGPHTGRRDTPSTPAGSWYLLALRAHELQVAGATDGLLAPAAVSDRIRPHPYQLRVVQQVLREKAPAAILADEVGLGKTIEAGLIFKELLLRDMVGSALVLAPKALLAQWQEELRERFGADFVLTEEHRFRGFAHEQQLICSFQQFVRAFDAIAARPWDCLIVDEAHLLANPTSKRRRCVSQLRTRWRLLLTATPVQNKLTDLYSLIDLIAPGRLGTLRQFIAEYATDPTTCRTVIPGKVAELRAAAAEVMCRTRRVETGIAFAPRSVETRLVAPGHREATLIREVTNYLRALYRRAIVIQAPQNTSRSGDRSARRRTRASSPGPAHGGEVNRAQRPDEEAGSHEAALSRGALLREIVALQQSLSSSPQAIGHALRARAEHHSAERALLLDLAAHTDDLRGAKEQLLLDALERLGREPALIFTLRLETARRLRQVIGATGRSADCYVGQLSSAERRTLVNRFNRGGLQALIATDAGAEGLNLQERCYTVFNYDLHWNPMKMEQRIGRVHRLGQTRAVEVVNFALEATIDEYVLALLYQKIDLFTMTIGALESVLADVQEGELDLEERILDAVLSTTAEQDVHGAVTALGSDLAAALARQRAAESLTTGVLG
jgi:SNF2 family DNA or RNA helicase